MCKKTQTKNKLPIYLKPKKAYDKMKILKF